MVMRKIVFPPQSFERIVVLADSLGQPDEIASKRTSNRKKYHHSKGVPKVAERHLERGVRVDVDVVHIQQHYLVDFIHSSFMRFRLIRIGLLK